MSFKSCSHVSITGGIFSSAVGGDQHNSNHIQGNLVRATEGQMTALAQFHELKLANIRLKRKIVESPVMRTDAGGWCIGETLDARRIIHAASIRGEDKNEEFLHVQYTGPDAVRAYEHDCNAFSTTKDVNWVELFGYIAYNALPALVFYDALVPVSHIFERNGFSCMLNTYLCFSAITQGVDMFTLFRELWVNPGNGTFRRGVYVPDSSNVHYWVPSWATLGLTNSNLPSVQVDLQTYKDTNRLFQYLIGILPLHSIIKGIRRPLRLTTEWPDNQDAQRIFSFLPGTIYHKITLDVIARYPGDRKRWYYHPVKGRSRVPDAMRENICVMRDGSVRFMLKPTEIASLDSFELYYDLQPRGMFDSFADSWVSQAQRIFIQLGIEEGEWGEYCVFSYFYVHFECVWDQEASHMLTNILPSAPIYLRIRPVPRPSDDESRWDAWLEGKGDQWSFDSAGKEEMSEDERRRLGLPSFKTTIKAWHLWWDHDAYDAVRMVNRHEHFDPLSLELARSLNYQILEVVGGNKRFEEV